MVMRRFNSRRGAVAELDRDENRGRRIVTLQSGLVDLVNPDLQADRRAARRSMDQGVDFLAGAGRSWRLKG
jgi:hypothetical protein